MQPISTAVAALVVATCLVLSASVHAASDPFTVERFEALQAEDALILVDIYAKWCPTCAQQTKILEEYRAQRPDVELYWLKVDFDNQKKWVKHFRAPRQSTLLIYRGDEQLWFSVAETRAEKVFDAIDAAAGAAP